MQIGRAQCHVYILLMGIESRKRSARDTQTLNLIGGQIRQNCNGKLAEANTLNGDKELLIQNRQPFSQKLEEKTNIFFFAALLSDKWKTSHLMYLYGVKNMQCCVP